MSTSERIGDELIQIGELYDGRHTPKRWVPITRNRRAPQPYPPESESWKRSDTKLWAGIASFRDSLCGQTLFNMFSKAAYPERITAGVVQQNLEEDVSCMKTYCDRWVEERGEKGCPYRENIRVLELSATEAQGPCWGRHMQSYLLADEEFCMQTDSHMDFVQNWDTLMMGEWAATRNEYGVLSTYVQDLTKLGVNVNRQHEVSHLCEVLWNQQPRNQQARAIHAMKEPKLTTTWGAGYSFSKCHAERAVPYDPYLHQIFDGEEFSKMLRLWTNGYDVYTPSRGYIAHDYLNREQKRSSWWGNGGKKSSITEGEEQVVDKQTANQRLWDLMEMPGHSPKGSLDIQSGPWGLGDKRTLDQFIEFTGANLRSKTYIGETGDRCGSDVEWVPYDRESPKAPSELGSGGPAHLRGPSADSAASAEPCLSWRTREGKDPIDVGPYWDKVQCILEESGVEVWWSPHRDDEPLSREAPHVVPDRSFEERPVSAGRGYADIRDALRDREVGESGPALGFPSRGVVDGDGNGDGDGPVFDAALGELGQRLPGSPAIVAKVVGVQSIPELSWMMMLGVVFIAMVAILVGMHEYGRSRARKRKKRRRRSRRSDIRMDDWVDKAFSTGGISPLGVTPLVWPTIIRKDREV